MGCAQCLIRKVVVTGEHVEIAYVLPFEEAPQVAERPGSTPEGTPGHFYRLRLAHLKTTMQMDVLHCKTVPGVLKELIVFALVYNLVRLVMCQSARLQHSKVERISFLDALRWLSAPNTALPLGALLVNPTRPHRVEPRVKKRRPKPFPLMIKPRQALRQQLVQDEPRG